MPLRSRQHSSTMPVPRSSFLRRFSQFLLIVQFAFSCCNFAIAGVSLSAAGSPPRNTTAIAGNDSQYITHGNITSSLAGPNPVTKHLSVAKKQQRTDDGDQVQTDDVIREEMLRATQQQQPFKSLGRRVGYVTIIRENQDIGGRENASESGSSVLENSGEATRDWSEVWRSRVR
jgi:hypothetical protein